MAGLGKDRGLHRVRQRRVGVRRQQFNRAAKERFHGVANAAQKQAHSAERGWSEVGWGMAVECGARDAPPYRHYLSECRVKLTVESEIAATSCHHARTSWTHGFQSPS